MYKDCRNSSKIRTKDVVEYVSRCIVCQQVKADRKRYAGFLHPNAQGKDKFQVITMDFVTGFPPTRPRN